MANKEPTGRIKIMEIPAGEAPLDIRRAWVGLILPCFPEAGYLDGGAEHCLLSGEKLAEERVVVIVPQDQAIAILLQHDRRAAAYFMAHGCGKEGQYFSFGANEVRIVYGVTVVPRRVFGDLETGHWEEMPLGTGGR